MDALGAVIEDAKVNSSLPKCENCIGCSLMILLLLQRAQRVPLFSALHRKVCHIAQDSCADGSCYHGETKPAVRIIDDYLELIVGLHTKQSGHEHHGIAREPMDRVGRHWIQGLEVATRSYLREPKEHPGHIHVPAVSCEKCPFEIVDEETSNICIQLIRFQGKCRLRSHRKYAQADGCIF